MPTSTFANLPEPKRRRIIEALKAEFASRPYSRASVDRIAAAAGVSKGSFYQYFHDKEDAYTHLLSTLMTRRIGLAQASVPTETLRDVLTAQVLGSRAFQAEDPAGWAVLARSYADDAPASREEWALSDGVHQWALAAITAGQESGELRDDVDPGTAAWMIEHLLMGLPEFVMRRFAIDPQRAAVDGSAFDQPRIAAVAQDIIAMIVSALHASGADDDQGGSSCPS
ncbi:TetR/AcrR family transcriptional regulator [Actinomyces slackii]|uniref:DNA-binding transcriptional repressor AcrR n=1 Tax=Actinomyces slackii TaxID=52774 RepID=A0A448KCY7_9ACTO|nr:TetR/AcrR family transcriptional regulator [Actinomyces slackii]VEG74798.1 DNA-binding transcriptional repressor AcrR [Actinomyces slackii]